MRLGHRSSSSRYIGTAGCTGRPDSTAGTGEGATTGEIGSYRKIEPRGYKPQTCVINVSPAVSSFQLPFVEMHAVTSLKVVHDA